MAQILRSCAATALLAVFLCAGFCALDVRADNPADLTLHLSTASGAFCKSADVNGFTFITCPPTQTNPSSWTTFGMQTPYGATPITGIRPDEPFNLVFKPGSSVRLVRLAISQNSAGPFGVALQASNSIRTPFMGPPSVPKPPSNMLSAAFVFEKQGAPGVELGWNGDHADGLVMKVKNVMWSTTFAADAYCSIRDLDDPTPVNGLTSLLVCDPFLSADKATVFRIEGAGSGSSTGVSLFSHHMLAFCGDNSNGYIECAGVLFKQCCVSEISIPGRASWWSYAVGSGTLPLSFNTPISFQSWDSNINIPVKYWAVDPVTKYVRVATAYPTANVELSYFRIVPINALSNTNSVADSDVALFHEDHTIAEGGRFCGIGAYGVLICDGTRAALTANVMDFTFTWAEEPCIGAASDIIC